MEDLWLQTVSILSATLRTATPLVFAAMAGMFSERSGTIDIGLEGKMLAGAFAAACVAVVTGSAWLALLGAILVGIMMGLLHGLACITYRGNQVVSGVAINIMAAGLTVVLGNAWFGRGGQTPDLAPDARFMTLRPPGWEYAYDIPIIGPVYAFVIGGHNLLVYIAFAAVPIGWWVLYHTRFGLRLRAVGEDPKVVDTAGISVTWLRYRAVIIAGILCGFAGAYLSIAQNAAFSPHMTAGRGFIALAAMVFGKWRPWPAMFACLLFGLLDAIAIRLQGVNFPGIGQVPVEAIQALPYILTVVLLAGFVGRAMAPHALGQPYVKER
ncbi:ABC transporter permease [Dongia deserti]|uniref:ABC transporter permease n=1 Tax=Dongia deserti TaxID=2268030 RepID=UPI000E65887C|nr:ABC transporter permease [Dongia deserti]